MQRMYNNDSHYQSLVGLFVAHPPGGAGASVWIDLQQPDQVHALVYANDSANGEPMEIFQAQSTQVTSYLPGANFYMVAGRHIDTAAPPLATVPLGMVEAIDSGITVGAHAPAALLADRYVHPSVLITSPFFTSKAVSLAAETTFGGRPCWELRGLQAPTSTVPSRLGDGWRMWVDKQTGIVLRLEYCSGSDLIGWAEFRNLSVDGAGQSRIQDPPAQLTDFSLPGGSRQVDQGAYMRLLPR